MASGRVRVNRAHGTYELPASRLYMKIGRLGIPKRALFYDKYLFNNPENHYRFLRIRQCSSMVLDLQIHQLDVGFVQQISPM